jgi:hypothetical protein
MATIHKYHGIGFSVVTVCAITALNRPICIDGWDCFIIDMILTI